MENLLKMFKITNSPTVPVGEDDNATDADEPPDDKLSELHSKFKKESVFKTSTPSGLVRRESLLTRAIQSENTTPPISPRMPDIPRGLSATSSHSFASTAELTSDVESPARSVSPSPPPQFNRIQIASPIKPIETGKVVIAALTKDDKPVVAVTGEAAVEKSLGRKRCIMFACREPPPDSSKETEVEKKQDDAPKIEPAPRKTRISFACPMKPVAEAKQTMTPPEHLRRQSSPCQRITSPAAHPDAQPRRATEANTSTYLNKDHQASPATIKSRFSADKAFHEFGGSHDDHAEWVETPTNISQPKLTIDDCLRKENAIRKLGKEAEEEAEEEEREQEELANEVNDDDDDDDVGDDFAPSDDDRESRSDDGNESDDEEGFADSDTESDGGSEYRFWAPSAATTRATSADSVTHFSARQRSRSRASSTSSVQSFDPAESRRRFANKVKASRAIKMRPGTPELPDSTDFVCGTLDEDRPLEAAYISCREQKRREKLVLIPQDIDPSFPTSDPEDHDDEDEQAGESSDQVWMNAHFERDDEDIHERHLSTVQISPLHSPIHSIAPPRSVRQVPPTRTTLRSPPPKQNLGRSPAPTRLFDHTQRRMRSPPPNGRLRSPRGSPTNMKPAPFGITINHLAQRPNAVKVSSLPHTPNPFFRNWQKGHQPISRITSTAVTSGTESPPSDLHVRGPVDIVIGLEKKRQKRKEKYWRQHCRKAAKEQAEKRPPPGRGVERMKELGLECAERTRGYGLGQPAQLVLSL